MLSPLSDALSRGEQHPIWRNRRNEPHTEWMHECKIPRSSGDECTAEVGASLLEGAREKRGMRKMRCKKLMTVAKIAPPRNQKKIHSNMQYNHNWVAKQSFGFSTLGGFEEKHLFSYDGIVLEHGERTMGTRSNHCPVVTSHGHGD